MCSLTKLVREDRSGDGDAAPRHCVRRACQLQSPAQTQLGQPSQATVSNLQKLRTRNVTSRVLEGLGYAVIRSLIEMRVNFSQCRFPLWWEIYLLRVRIRSSQAEFLSRNAEDFFSWPSSR